MKVYKTWKYGNEIETVEAVRVTESSVFLIERGRERRRNRESESETYFDNKEHAIESLKSRAKRKAAHAQATLNNAIAELAAINAQYPEVSE